MSNLEASKVYELIVESVVNEVREDFENAGIDEQTLQDLKRVWQIKLSETQVTKFSWDPQEADGQTLVNNVANMNRSSNEITGNNINGISTNVKNVVPSEYSLNSDSQGLVLPGFSNDDTNKEGQSNTVNSSSVDQSGNMQSQEEENQGDAEDRNGADKEVDESTLKSEQDGDPKLENSQEIELTISYPDEKSADMLKQQAKKAKRSALLDTDEVGSELDDSDDDYLISEGEEDGPDENLMLCLYDKVTRTKARWKCSLKDGIATVNRKDYTFQKSQVEAEWV